MEITIIVGVAFSIFLTVAFAVVTGLSGVIADIWKTFNDIRERRARLRIDSELARHGLTSDMVLETLNGMDEFRFFMHGAECIARKGPDGHHQFMLIGEDPPVDEGRPDDFSCQSATPDEICHSEFMAASAG